MQSIAKLLLAKPPVTNWKHVKEELESSKTQLRGCVVPAWCTRGNPKFCRGNPKLCRGKSIFCRGPKNQQNRFKIISTQKMLAFLGEYKIDFLVCDHLFHLLNYF